MKERKRGDRLVVQQGNREHEDDDGGNLAAGATEPAADREAAPFRDIRLHLKRD